LDSGLTTMDGGNADIAGAIYLPGILYLHRHSPPLRETDSVPLGVAPGWRAIQAYHVPHDSQIDRVRTSLYTGWVFGCVGSPSILADLPTVAILALGPNGGSSPAAFTIRNTKTSLTLSIPTVPQGADSVPLTAASLTESLRPRRCQQRPLGSETGDTTPCLNPQLPSCCSAVNHATSCRSNDQAHLPPKAERR